MNEQQLLGLMHRVIDGEATPAERDELKGYLALHPEAAEQWRTLQLAEQAFRGMVPTLDELLPQVEVPDGMTSLVMQKWNLEQPADLKPFKRASIHPLPVPMKDKARKSTRFNRPLVQIGMAAAAIAFWVIVGGLFNPEEEIKSPELFIASSDDVLQQTGDASRLNEQSTGYEPEATASAMSQPASGEETSTVQESLSAAERAEDSSSNGSSSEPGSLSGSANETVTGERAKIGVGSSTGASESSSQTPAMSKPKSDHSSDVSIKAVPSSAKPVISDSTPKSVMAAETTDTGDATAPTVEQSVAMNQSVMASAIPPTEQMNASAKSGLPQSSLLPAKPDAAAIDVPDAGASYRFDDNTRIASIDGINLTVKDSKGVLLLETKLISNGMARVLEWNWDKVNRQLSVTFQSEQVIRSIRVDVQ